MAAISGSASRAPVREGHSGEDSSTGSCGHCQYADTVEISTSAVGWTLPEFGVTLLAFLVVDVTVNRRREPTVDGRTDLTRTRGVTAEAARNYRAAGRRARTTVSIASTS